MDMERPLYHLDTAESEKVLQERRGRIEEAKNTLAQIETGTANESAKKELVPFFETLLTNLHIRYERVDTEQANRLSYLFDRLSAEGGDHGLNIALNKISEITEKKDSDT